MLNLRILLFVYFWLHWVFIAVCGLSLVAARGDCSLVAVLRLLVWWLLLLRGTGYRCASFSRCNAQIRQLWLAGSRVRSQQLWCRGFSWSIACGIFPDQGSNSCCLCWQADSYSLYQGSRESFFTFRKIF